MVATIPDALRAFLLPHVRHLRARGWNVDGAALGVSRDSECIQAFDNLWDVSWSRNPLDPRNFLEAPQRIREIAIRGAYDLVHVHTPVASLVTRYALRRLRMTGRPRVIYTAHGFHFYRGGSMVRNQVFRSVERLAGLWTDYLVVLNQEDHEAAVRYRLVPPGRLIRMPGIGVDTATYNPEAVSETDVASVRRELGLSREQPAFLMIAEFNPGKRHRDALHAFARLKERAAILLFAGSGRLMPAMERLATALKIRDRVRFLGYRRDIPTLIRASIATVLPSEREGLPRSIMESLALAVPAVAADIRGIRDLVDEQSGLLFPVGDVEALAAAMTWILWHPEQAAEMGLQGRRRMAAHDLRLILSRHEDLYAQALAQAGKHQSASAA